MQCAAVTGRHVDPQAPGPTPGFSDPEAEGGPRKVPVWAVPRAAAPVSRSGGGWRAEAW